MQNEPSPLFKQGISARVKLIVFVVVAFILMLCDARFKVLGNVRMAINTVLYPFQQVAILPADFVDSVQELFRTGDDLQGEIDQLRKKALDDAPTIQKSAQLEQENAQLRELLGLKRRMPVQTVGAEILYDVHSHFISKIVINRGSGDGVLVGQAVIDENGVIGQVSNVWLATSEVTLLTDRSQAIPVLNARTGERTVATGEGNSGYLRLRFVPATADIQEGDRLVTSGIDGVYPAGTAVAVISKVIPASAEVEGKVLCTPLGGVDRGKHVLVMLTDTSDYPEKPPMEVKRKKGELPQPQPQANQEGTP